MIEGPALTPARSKVLLLVIGLTLVWGTNWVLFPLAVREVSVWTFRAICLLGSGALLLFIARIRGLSLFIPPKQRVGLTVAALVYLVIWNVGSTYSAILIPSGQAAVLGFTMPLWATLISWTVLGERPSRCTVLGVVLATGGVACLAFGARHSYASAPLGFVLRLSAGIAWACGTLILKRAKLTVPLLVSTGWQLVIGGVPILFVALASYSPHAPVPSWTTVLVIGYITVVPMALGNIAWFSIVDSMPATLSGLSTAMVPMIAMVTGAYFRGEPLGPIEITAMALSGSALVITLRKRQH